MAQVTKVQLVDDIDGSEADESVKLTIDDKALEIDLSNENAEKLRGLFAPYMRRRVARTVRLLAGSSA